MREPKANAVHVDHISWDRSEDEKFRGMESRPQQVNLNLNLEGRIQNPLYGIPAETLLRDVEDFAHRRGLVDALPLLRKGALVARDPENYEDIVGEEALDEPEVEALRDEVLHKAS